MSDNKLVKTVIDAATLMGLAAGIGWAAKKVVLPGRSLWATRPSGSFKLFRFTYNLLCVRKRQVIRIAMASTRSQVDAPLPAEMLKQLEQFNKNLNTMRGELEKQKEFSIKLCKVVCPASGEEKDKKNKY